MNSDTIHDNLSPAERETLPPPPCEPMAPCPPVEALAVLYGKLERRLRMQSAALNIMCQSMREIGLAVGAKVVEIRLPIDFDEDDPAPGTLQG